MRLSPPLSRRRALCTAATAALFSGACGVARRRASRITYLVRGESSTLDPAKAPGGPEIWIMAALFEPLLQPHPQTMTPMAGIATHYHVERDATRYTFYLRGHPAPSGARLAGPDSLPIEFRHGAPSAAYDVPARWSDGVPLTAHDLVYSWRRYLAPDTGNPNASLLYC